MPRPTDHYAHAQFEPVESDHRGETVRCMHCKQWTGSLKTLNRKKDHLMKCRAYASWRAAGNGQDLAPPNKYQKRDSAGVGEVDPYSQNYGDYSPDTLSSDRPFDGMPPPSQQTAASGSNGVDVFGGRAPNPMFARPNKRQRVSGPSSTPARPIPQSKPLPSMVSFLINKNHSLLEFATQLPFLSHAGCGTLSKPALQQYLSQQGHVARAFCAFIGNLIGKIRLPATSNPSADTSWRALDLLVSALNNAKRELEFLRDTCEKFNLHLEQEIPRPAAKGFIDLFASATAAPASLLEGLVVLWTMEYLYCMSWQYAANFIQPNQPSSTAYTVPTYLQSGYQNTTSTYPSMASSSGGETAHTAALHGSFIPNWTSIGFTKFVDACKAIVDELANAQNTGNGASELGNCEANFRQAVWLWKQMFPEVNGMGEEDDALAVREQSAHATGNGEAEGNGPAENLDDGDDRDEDAPSADSPYGGTGMSAVATSNRAA